MKRKMLISYIILLLIAVLTTGLLSFSLTKNNYINQKKEKLITNGNLIIETLKLQDQRKEEINFYALTQMLSKQINARVTFIDSSGKAIADSMNNSVIFKDQSDYQEVKEANGGKIGWSIRYSEEVDRNIMFLAMPAIEIGTDSIIVRMTDSIDDINNINRLYLKYTLISILVGLVATLIIGYLNIENMVKPIKELTNAAKLISKGDFSQKINVYTNDEIEILSNTFNKMSNRLNTIVTEIKNKNTELDAILTSLVDGLIAVNSVNQIIMVNEAAQIILGSPDDIKRGMIINNIKSLQFIVELIEKTKEERKPLVCERKLRYEEINIIIRINTSIIKENDDLEEIKGILILIEDVTEVRKLEKLRSEFVANVSHELRTPLTSISGFVETLRWQDLSEDERNKSIDIIEFETERLKRLINNLLSLSEIENIKTVRKYYSLNVEEILKDVINLLLPNAQNKNIDLQLIIDIKLNNIVGDRDWMKQVLVNLIDNSIKYTNENGWVNVRCSNVNKGIEIIVEDNGIGIPKEDIDRVFERFYRVDKSRKTKSNSNGIGLAIVKNIVKEFGGKIDVESELGKGSKFILFLPSEMKVSSKK